MAADALPDGPWVVAPWHSGTVMPERWIDGDRDGTPPEDRGPFATIHTTSPELAQRVVEALNVAGVAAGPQATPPKPDPKCDHSGHDCTHYPPGYDQPEQPQATPDQVRHPGEALKDVLIERDMTQVQLAVALGHANASQVSRLLNGRADINAATAVRLEQALGIGAEVWLRLQVAFDLHCARRVVAVPTAEEGRDGR